MIAALTEAHTRMVELQYDGRTVRYTYEDFEQLVRDGQVPPHALIRFPAATGDRFVPLRSLELYRELAQSDQARLFRELSSASIPWLTALLVGIQVRVFLFSLLPGRGSSLVERLANWSPAELELGQVYRLLTYGFLHLGVTHIAFNLLFLAYTGWSLERAMGRWNLLSIYLASVFSGGLLSMAMSPDRPSLGASGGDFGLIAAAVVFGWKYGDLIPKSAQKYYGWALLVYLVGALLSGVSSVGVDNWGHLGGLLGGGAMLTLLHPEALSRHRAHNRAVRLGVLCLAAAVCASMALWGQHLVPLEGWSYRGLTAARPSAWLEGWTFTGDRGFFSPTQQATLVLDTTVHVKPVDLERATDRYLTQVDAGGRDAVLGTREATTFAGWPAVRIETELDLSGERYVLHALLVARGHYLHRVQLHTTDAHADRYRTLWERIMARTALDDPPELVDARRKAGDHLTSWRAQADLAAALGRAGNPIAALQAWWRAQELNHHGPEPVVGALQLMAAYRMEGRHEAVAAALATHGGVPAVRLAAADVLDSLDERLAADEVLMAGWRLVPGNGELRRALLLRGLTVPAAPDDLGPTRP
ncbi:MAG: rhomboid family intramembrane serine protease [Pseudomonadota bacterium]